MPGKCITVLCCVVLCCVSGVMLLPLTTLSIIAPQPTHDATRVLCVPHATYLIRHVCCCACPICYTSGARRQHYIPHRKHDWISGAQLRRAPRRVSLTFRQVCVGWGGGGSGTANDASQCAVPLLTAPGVAGTRAVSVTVRPQMLCGEGVLPLLLLRPIILSACLPAGTYWHKLQLQLPCLL